ncbi:hypothetical protein M5K25_016821 [Dendrobium thyrsiflorum]|uniref:Uncharacterized protein n=1 Tax=Dendrobium thyrsiflorum TaxID=117978 RepID=A0ABD0UL74_DENTH
MSKLLHASMLMLVLTGTSAALKELIDEKRDACCMRKLGCEEDKPRIVDADPKENQYSGGNESANHRLYLRRLPSYPSPSHHCPHSNQIRPPTCPHFCLSDF